MAPSLYMKPSRTDRLLALNDPLLARFLAAPDDIARQRELELLIVDVAQPVTATVVDRFMRSEWLFRPEDAEDVAGVVTLRTIGKLQSLAGDEGEAIERFADYVAALAQNAVADVLRRRYPEMTRLRRRIRHLLSSDERFAIWMTQSGAVCGERTWQGREQVVPLPVTPRNATDAMCVAGNAAASLAAIFAGASGPVSFDELTKLVSKLWGIAEVIVVDAEDVAPIDERPAQIERFESRRFLETLWSEVQSLRPAQRAALLLNLRDIDGSNALSLLVILEIATFDDIARALEITPARLAELWNGLPIDDRTIASMLGTTRQQVINLRRAARERLTRRLK